MLSPIPPEWVPGLSNDALWSSRSDVHLTPCERIVSVGNIERDMRVTLVVNRGQDDSGISAMVWTAGEDDPKLLESKRFVGDAALKVWLSGIATRYGPSNITVDWNTSLTSDDVLTATVRECLELR